MFFPATSNVPNRAADKLFAWTPILTVPLPVPVLPELMVIQGTVLVALQLHPACVVTLIVWLPPVAGKDCWPGETV
ncbi:MAG: hypothetical protein IPG76_06745 [Acidobacteria bacterium]|nr:hypothetical protein [Acidobacteriota bacterium]